MPILPPVTAAPYPIASQVLDIARGRLNDVIVNGGDVLKNYAPFARDYFNAGYQRIQEMLAALGFARFKNEAIIYSLPVVAPIFPSTFVDPASQCWMNWEQFFDGYNYYPAPVLPQDFISPLIVWERPTTTAPMGIPSGPSGTFLKMDRADHGIPAEIKRYRNWRYQWLDDRLTLPGSTVLTDLRLYYAAYLPDLVDSGDPWYKQKVPISRSADALAWFISSEVSKARGDMDGDYFDSMAAAATARLAGRSELEQRTAVKYSELEKMGDSRTPGVDPAPLVKAK